MSEPESGLAATPRLEPSTSTLQATSKLNKPPDRRIAVEELTGKAGCS